MFLYSNSYGRATLGHYEVALFTSVKWLCKPPQRWPNWPVRL